MRPARLTASGHPPPMLPPLIAVAHGSADPRAGATIAELLALVAAEAPRHGLAGLRVRTAFLGHAPPALHQVLDSLDADSGPPAGAARRPHAIVLPLLLTAADHSGAEIPELLRGIRATRPGLRVSYGLPLGPHSLLLGALDRRIAAAGISPGPGTSVVLAAAGSSQRSANQAVARVAAAWQAARGWQAVTPAYASAASPSPAQAVVTLRRRGARRIVVATYLLAPGFFADRVRGTALAAGAAVVCPPLGASPELARLLLHRYQQALRRAQRVPGGTGRQAARP